MYRLRNCEDERGLTKDDEAIARFVRFNCPTKSAAFEGREVQYFSGSKAIDTLYESKYGTKADSEPRFPTRHSAFAFLKKMLEQGLFFRARRFVRKALNEGGDGKEETDQSTTDVEKDRNGKEEIDKEVERKEEAEGQQRRPKKVKLAEHPDQYFTDSSDVYVWIFDPTPMYKKVLGCLLIVVCLLICMFPVWPSWTQLIVYYVSLVGLCSFGALFGTAFLRTLLFVLIWMVSGGRYKLWILPNLTEECGFVESFQPLYSYECCQEKDEDKDD
ncbi:hypothetical protein QR680_007354 [Steinernema hermaphroditum]|uniref:Translocation protein SEC62 n=1 Tax=Steinernema hermaphroditum TaxID=289476 RepID=A0AA39IF52_9BILA|nr:hypothetical protein QR680_007354 [Steinernema hermaphroditum]